MASVERIDKNFYQIMISADGMPYTKDFEYYKVWFYFSMRGVKPGETLTLKIGKINIHNRVYNAGLKPVVKTETQPKWRTLTNELTCQEEAGGCWIQFTFTFPQNDVPNNTYYFATTFPYTYSDAIDMCMRVENAAKSNPQIYIRRELLAYSYEGRRVDLLTITNNNLKQPEKEELL